MSEMSPSLAGNNVSDVLARNTEAFSDLSLATESSRKPDSEHGFSRKCRLAVTLALARSPFPNHVGHVASMCSDRQVIRSHARRSVAFMQHFKIVVDGTVGENHRHAMCQPAASLKSDFAIARIRSAASPQPTGISLVNLGPKTLFDRNGTPSSRCFIRPAHHSQYTSFQAPTGEWKGQHP